MDRLRHAVELERLPEAEACHLWDFLESLSFEGGRCLLRNDLVIALQRYQPRDRSLRRFLRRLQEVVATGEGWVLMHRPRVGQYAFYDLRREDRSVRRLGLHDFLAVKEGLVGAGTELHLDFAPFRQFPSGGAPGGGLGPVLPRLVESFRQDAVRLRLLRFLRPWTRHVRPQDLARASEEALHLLGGCAADTPVHQVAGDLHLLGFESGFGDTAGRVAETLRLVAGLLESATGDGLRRLAERLPTVRRVLLVSPHGWFGQEGVLGRPDTGGQVIYVLDQVRALEAAADRALAAAGLDGGSELAVLTRLIPDSDGTTCHLPHEPVEGSRRARILRVPMRDGEGRVLDRWITRFHLWPYLERFAREARPAAREDLGGPPDLVVGNYSDGNLVASLLAQEEGATQVTIAHALEKTKYLFSELYWQDLERDYRFSKQFVADLLAMNLSHLVVTSTRQEIAGTRSTFGQYESYSFFTMPGLLRVTGGVDLFDPRFLVIPPGVDETVYFPYWEEEKRSEDVRRETDEFLFTASHAEARGRLEEPGLRPVFSMSRLDRIKNITGLVEAFGRSDRLRQRCNLVLVTGRVFPDQARDAEERHEIERMEAVLEENGLWGQVRWLGLQLPRRYAGEVYRTVADRGGIFVQPALFEAFGLTVLEAMASGLPTFATRFGGPMEIVDHGTTGYLLNPTRPDLLAAPLEEFLDQLEEDPDLWGRVSRAAVARVDAHYRWRHHAEQLLSAVRLHKLVRALAGRRHRALQRYADALRHFLLR